MEILTFGLLCLIYSKLQEEDIWKTIWWVSGVTFIVLGDIILITKLL